MFGFLKGILAAIIITFAGFLISNKNYREDFDEFLKKLSRKAEENHTCILIIILVFAFFLRIWKLGLPEFWYDEAFSSLLIRRPWMEMFRYSLTDIHPPFYYIILRIWALFFGYSDFALRFLSALFGTALIFIVYKFGVKFSDSKILGLVTSLVFAVNPFLINYSQEARSYALLTFLIVGTVHALHKREWFMFSVFLSLTFLTHYMALFFLPGIFLVLFFEVILDKEKLLPRLLSLLLPTIILALWSPFLFRQWKIGQKSLNWIPKVTFSDLFFTLYTFLFGSSGNLYKALLIFLSVITISLVFFFRSKGKKRRRASYLLLLSTLPIFLILFASIYLDVSLYIDRILIGYLSILLFYLIFVFSSFHRYLGIAILIFYLCITLDFHFSQEVNNLGYRELAEYAENSSKLLVFTDPLQYGTIKHYLTEDSLSGVRLQDNVIAPSGWPLIFPEEIVVKKEIQEPFYLVNHGPLKGWDYTEKIQEFYLYKWEN